MKTVAWRVAGLAMTLSLAAAMPAAAQQTTAPAVLTLPVAGTFSGGGEFTGSVSINRFEQRGNQIVAVGFVAGVLSRHRRIGTAVAGEIAWPVSVRSGGQLIANADSRDAVRSVPIAWSSGPRAMPRILLAQAQSCSVLSVGLGPMNVDLLGTQVALGAVTFDLAGQSGTPLGDLVCAVSDLLGNVAGLVNLLNSLLGLLTGLLGGLTGGLGGVV
jgi:hypothetical protein